MTTEGKAYTEQLEALYEGFPCGRLWIKLAQTENERQEIFRLRFRVFNDELGEGIPENREIGMDIDPYDAFCDHLMVLSEDKKKVVGTYRLLPGVSRPESGFYSETEFNLKSIPINFSEAVELGRGCIEPEFRRQTTLMALFWGLHRYMFARNARYLLGCGSLPKMSNDDAEATFDLLASRGVLKENLQAYVLESHRFSGDPSLGKAQIPALIEFYLQFGANVLCRPAYDPVFGCFDLLMLFDMDNLSEWGQDLLERFDRRLLARANRESPSGLSGFSIDSNL